MSLKFISTGLFLCACFVLPGCSGVNDALGLSKASAPDESQVAVNRSLAIPPDYSLRPPSEGAPATVAEPAPVAAPTQTQSNGAQEIAPSVTGQPAPSTQTASTQVNGGIAPNHPDGTPKTAEEIRQEAREKKLEQERAANPDYGTWKNIFNW